MGFCTHISAYATHSPSFALMAFCMYTKESHLLAVQETRQKNVFKGSLQSSRIERVQFRVVSTQYLASTLSLPAAIKAFNASGLVQSLAKACRGVHPNLLGALVFAPETNLSSYCVVSPISNFLHCRSKFQWMNIEQSSGMMLINN